MLGLDEKGEKRYGSDRDQRSGAADGTEGPEASGGFWDSKAGSGWPGRRETTGPRPDLSGFEDGLGHLQSIQIDESDLVHGCEWNCGESTLRQSLGSRTPKARLYRVIFTFFAAAMLRGV